MAYYTPGPVRTVKKVPFLATLLLLGLAVSSLGIAFVLSVVKGQFIIAFVLSLGALLWSFCAFFPALRFTLKQITVIIVFALAGVLASFLVDHSQGVVGEFFWQTHRGFPYPWLGGRIAVPYSFVAQADRYISQHFKDIHWSVYWPGLVIDGLFWVHSSAILIAISRYVLYRKRYLGRH